MAEPVLKIWSSESRIQRHNRGTKLSSREHRYHEFGARGKNQCNAVACLDPQVV